MKLLIAGFLVILCISGCKSKLTAETTGHITNTTVSQETETKRTRNSNGAKRSSRSTKTVTEIYYTYQVGSQSYTGRSKKTSDVRGNFAIGATAVVCYNPSAPEQSDIFNLGKKCTA